MSRSTRWHGNQDGNPGLPHVEHVELSERKVRLRFVLVLVFLLIGALGIAFGVKGITTASRGWQEIETNSSAETSVAGDFVLQYDVGASGVAASVEARQLSALYTESSVYAYRAFSAAERFDGVGNLRALCDAPGETVTLEPALYDALALLESAGRREHYLAPLYEVYANLFSSEVDEHAAEFDPERNAETAEFFAAALSFVNDPVAVQIELLSDYRARLRVSAEYRAFAEEWGIGAYVDLGWLRNAFAADYIADALSAAGFTRGTLSSYDGYYRCLDTSSTTYSCTVLDREGSTVYPAASLEYSGPMSLVRLRDYPTVDLDAEHYYEYADGTIRSIYISTADGLPRAAVSDVLAWSPEKSCGEIAVQLLPLWLAERWDSAAAHALSGTKLIWCEGSVIYCTDSAAVPTGLYDADGVRYRLAG